MWLDNLKAAILRPLTSSPIVPGQQKSPDAYPSITLSSASLSANIALPEVGGYYQGTRFDHSGLIRTVSFENHTFFGEWKPSHMPSEHDAVAGPAEEFGMQKPLGYEEARVGKPFYKIGVGALRKTKAGDYLFFGTYPLIDRGTWTVTHGESWAQFIHEINGERGWAYRYTKRVELQEDKPMLVITHILENTGVKTIDTNQYCHNFVCIDNEPIGANYKVRFDFEPQIKDEPFQRFSTVEADTMTFPKPLEKAIYTEFATPNTDIFMRIENTKSGAALEIRGDHPASEWHIYAVSSAFCPEPFQSLIVPAGEETIWRTSYEFSTFEIMPSTPSS